MVKTWLIDYEKETDDEFLKTEQKIEVLTFRVYVIEETNLKMNIELLENFVLSGVGYEISNDKCNVKFF